MIHLFSGGRTRQKNKVAIFFTGSDLNHDMQQEKVPQNSLSYQKNKFHGTEALSYADAPLTP